MADELAIRIKLLYEEGAAPGSTVAGARGGASKIGKSMDHTRSSRYWSDVESNWKTEEHFGKHITRHLRSSVRFGAAVALGAGLELLGSSDDLTGALSRVGAASLTGLFMSGGNPVAALATGLMKVVEELKEVQNKQAEKLEQSRKAIEALHRNAREFQKEQNEKQRALNQRVDEAIEKANQKGRDAVDELVYQTRLAQVR